MCAMFFQGGRPIHPSEDIFSRELAKLLPDDFLVVSNPTIDWNRTNYDLDCAVIGPPGVVIVELKSWKGPIEVQPGLTWLRYLNGEQVSIPSPSELVNTKQRVFHSRLHADGMTHVSVVGIVALFGDRYQLKGRREDRRFVVPAGRVAEGILSRKFVFNASNIRATTAAERFRIRDMLVSKPASGGPMLLGYDVGPLVDSNEEEGWFEFSGTEKLTKSPVRVRIWPVKLESGDRSPALREARALSLVNSPQVIRYFCICRDYDHDDTMLTVMEDLPSNCLHDYLRGDGAASAPPAGTPSRDELRRWLRLAFVGLDACHDHGIVHRNINPRSVRVVEGRGPVITEFHLARVPGIPTIGQIPYLPSPFIAPEIANSLAHASPRSDLYSMAAVFAALVGATSERGAEARRGVLRMEFGERVGDVLAEYLSDDPAGRPESAKTLLAAF